MYAIQHRCMSLKVDVSRTKLLYVIFEFVLLRITIIYLTKHRCIHVRNFVRKKPPYLHVKLIESQTDSQQNQDVNLTECSVCKERPVIIAQGLVDFQVELKLIKANSPRPNLSLSYTSHQISQIKQVKVHKMHLSDIFWSILGIFGKKIFDN